MCLGQLLALKNHSNFYLSNNIIKKIAPLYISPHLAHNILSDRLWVALPQCVLNFKLCSAITSYSRVQFLLTKVQEVVWTL